MGVVEVLRVAQGYGQEWKKDLLRQQHDTVVKSTWASLLFCHCVFLDVGVTKPLWTSVSSSLK